ncbi:UNVERIFIED_CONTAM: hypothetical protein RKD50_000695 [Streptomyces canus]
MASPTDNRIRRRARAFLRRTGRGYAGTHVRPLRGCPATMAAFGVYTSGWAAVVRLRGRPLPDRPEPWDVLLTSVATFRLSRLLSKAPVTSPLRAPSRRTSVRRAPPNCTRRRRPRPARRPWASW